MSRRLLAIGDAAPLHLPHSYSTDGALARRGLVRSAALGVELTDEGAAIVAAARIPVADVARRIDDDLTRRTRAAAERGVRAWETRRARAAESDS